MPALSQFRPTLPPFWSIRFQVMCRLSNGLTQTFVLPQHETEGIIELLRAKYNSNTVILFLCSKVVKLGTCYIHINNAHPVTTFGPRRHLLCVMLFEKFTFAS